MISGTKTTTVERIATGALRANCYVVTGQTGEAVLVDPGEDTRKIVELLAARDIRPLAILLTHGHDDHVAGAAEIADHGGVSVHMHLADSAVLRRANLYRVVGRREAPIRVPAVDVDLAGIAALRFGRLTVGVLHTPGHTPGSVCFEIEGDLFTGDTLFAGSAGRTDLHEGDAASLTASLALLGDRYPARALIRPGHGEPAPLGEAVLHARAQIESR